MESYTLEREYSVVQKVGVIARMFFDPQREGKVTAQEAAKAAGCQVARAYKILNSLSDALYLYKEGAYYVMGQFEWEQLQAEPPRPKRTGRRPRRPRPGTVVEPDTPTATLRFRIGRVVDTEPARFPKRSRWESDDMSGDGR